jgi:hypothetical protein
MVRTSSFNQEKKPPWDKPQKNRIKDKIHNTIPNHMENRNHLQTVNVIVDTVQESQKKYRESQNIGLDPEYIIEEQEKRQPLSFQE